MSHGDYPKILAEAQPFHGLPHRALEAVWQAGQAMEIPSGVDAFVQGDAAERCYILLDGRIKITKNSSFNLGKVKKQKPIVIFVTAH